MHRLKVPHLFFDAVHLFFRALSFFLALVFRLPDFPGNIQAQASRITVTRENRIYILKNFGLGDPVGPEQIGKGNADGSPVMTEAFTCE